MILYVSVWVSKLCVTCMARSENWPKARQIACDLHWRRSIVVPGDLLCICCICYMWHGDLQHEGKWEKKTNYRTSTERETKRLFGSFCLDKMRNQTYLLHFITGPGSLKSTESMEIFHEAFGSLPSQTTRSGPDVSIGLVRTNRVSIQQDQLRALASACLSAFESKLWQLWQSHFGSFGSFGCKVSDDFAIFAINDTTWCKRLQRWSRDLLRC